MAIKKIWYEVLAPEMFGKVQIGETPAFEPKNLIGRNIKVNIIELGKEYSKFFMKIIFKIDQIDGTKVYTKFIGHEITADRIFRMVQRRTRKVDCIDDFKTSDDQNIRLKIIAILANRTGTSIKDAARKKIKSITEKFVSGVTLEVLVKSILTDQFQRIIKEECKKVYPVAAVEVRKSEIL